MSYYPDFGDQIIRLLLQKYHVDINVLDKHHIYPLFYLYSSPSRYRPFELHSLLWSPQSINDHNNLYSMNAIQKLCKRLYSDKSLYLYNYLTEILSSFMDINTLYSALIHTAYSYELSAFQYINQSGSQEHKDLLKIIYYKVKRSPLLIYVNIIKNKMSLPHRNKIQLLLHKMRIMHNYGLRGVLSNIGVNL